MFILYYINWCRNLSISSMSKNFGYEIESVFCFPKTHVLMYVYFFFRWHVRQPATIQAESMKPVTWDPHPTLQPPMVAALLLCRCIAMHPGGVQEHKNCRILMCSLVQEIDDFLKYKQALEWINVSSPGSHELCSHPPGSWWEALLMWHLVQKAHGKSGCPTSKVSFPKSNRLLRMVVPIDSKRVEDLSGNCNGLIVK